MDEIGKLLEQATTPLERSILLKMLEQTRADGDLIRLQRELTSSVQKLTDSFVAHREEFIAHRGEFNKHVVEESLLLTWGVRIFGTTATLLVFIVSMFGWYTVRHVIDVNQAQQTSIDINSNRLTALESLVKEERERHGIKQ